MSIRQKILKATYPFWMWFSKLRGKNVTQLVNREKDPPVSFYSLNAELNDGSNLDFSVLKGKKILLVNTASDCGYTRQYEDLQRLYQDHQEKLSIIAFPANDFKEQEKGTDQEIAAFCRLNYGVSFPLVKKSIVKKSSAQHPVFQWLTNPAKNGWNAQAPSWNFTKYLVGENGSLISYFGPSISPLSKEIVDAVTLRTSDDN